MRGTVLVTRTGINLTNVTNLPSGLAIAADYRGTWLINIFTPSGTARRHEREQFYNNEQPYLLRAALAKIIVGGDFNCVHNRPLQL
jgi:exonuclease III